MKKKKIVQMHTKLDRLLYHLGTVLIMFSLAGFVFIFYPLISAYFPQKLVTTQASAQGDIIITIPKINAQAQVISNVDPWDERIYDEALKKGVAQAKGTALPGEKGTTFLFAHSSGLPWEMTRMNTIFLRLGELQTGDSIIIQNNGKKLEYKVRETKVVDPSQVHYLLDTKRTQLILQTCTPIGTSLQRLLIFADPV